jgi:serine/threonine protein kinase
VQDIFTSKLKATRMLREIILLRKMNDSRFVKIFDLIEPRSYEPRDFDTLYIVLEYAESDMRKLIKSQKFLNIDQVKKITYELFCAVKYMHSASVLHRDLKPGNILLSEDLSEVKICDFGLARSISGLHSTFKMVSTKRKGSDGTDQMHQDEEPSHWKDDVDIGVEADNTSMKPKLKDKFGEKPLSLQI